MIKLLQIIILLLIAIVSSSAQSCPKSSLQIEFNGVATSWCSDYNEYGNQNDSISYSNIYGVLVIRNTSDTAVSFWMMNCSWTDHIKTLPTDIIFGFAECDRNFPEIVNLKVGQSLNLNSVIHVPKNIYTESLNTYQNIPGKQYYSTFKIGFLIIDVKNFSYGEHQLFYELLDSHDSDPRIIWTEPISLRSYYYDWCIL